jgi:hypothetical protein
VAPAQRQQQHVGGVGGQQCRCLQRKAHLRGGGGGDEGPVWHVCIWCAVMVGAWVRVAGGGCLQARVRVLQDIGTRCSDQEVCRRPQPGVGGPTCSTHTQASRQRPAGWEASSALAASQSVRWGGMSQCCRPNRARWRARRLRGLQQEGGGGGGARGAAAPAGPGQGKAGRRSERAWERPGRGGGRGCRGERHSSTAGARCRRTCTGGRLPGGAGRPAAEAGR